MFVPMAAVDEVTGEITASEDRSLADVREKSYKTFSSGDVLFAKITPCMENGKAAVVPPIASGLGFGSTEFHVLRPGPSIERRYLWHFVRQQTYRQRAEQNMTGSVGQARVPKEFVEQTVIPLPPLDIQRELVATLDLVNSKGASAAARLAIAMAKTERFRQAVLAAACSGQLTADWRNEHPHHAGGVAPSRRLEIDRLADTPESWTWVQLQDIAEVRGGIQKGAKQRPDESTRAVPYLRVANVQRGWLDLSEIKTISASDTKIRDLTLRPGDILFNEGGDRDKLGRGWVWEGQIEECIHQNHVFRARLLDSAMQPRFYSWYGNIYGASYFSDQGKQTVNLASLSMTKLKELPVPVPSVEEQAEIVRRVNECLAVFDRLRARVDTAARRVDRSLEAVLAKAFRGDLIGVSKNGGDSGVA